MGKVVSSAAPIQGTSFAGKEEMVAFGSRSESNNNRLLFGSKVRAQSPIPNAAGTPGASAACAKNLPDNRTSLRKEMMQPKFLGLMGLAIAITLWGFGYRLSQYQLHPSSAAHAAAAKLCIEPRNDSLGSAARLKLSAHLLSVASAVSASAPVLPRIENSLTRASEQNAQRPVSFRFLIPFRSPPPQSFLLA